MNVYCRYLDILIPREEEVNEAVELLGGRLSDLERVVAMVKKDIPIQSSSFSFFFFLSFIFILILILTFFLFLFLSLPIYNLSSYILKTFQMVCVCV